MIIRAIERVFSEGCGLRMADAIQSPRFKALRDETENLFESFGPRTDKGTALRAGHLTMGRLMNTFSEREALKKARRTESQFGHGVEMRPLIQLLGEEMMKAAEGCLTEEIKEMAIAWRKANAGHQLEISKSLFETLISSVQVKHIDEEVTWEVARRNMWNDFENNRHDDAKVLPKQYGLWNKDSCVANCQGKTQMLAAFAKLAGAEAMVVSPTVSARYVLEKTRRLVVDEILSGDIEERAIRFPDAKFSESMEAYRFMSNFNKSVLGECFHVCIALRVRNGDWVMVDPHALDWGVFPKGWELEKVFKILRKYGKVLPGLQITAHDHRNGQRELEKSIDSIKSLLERSRKLEKSIGGNFSPDHVAKVLIETGELDFLHSHLVNDKDKAIPDEFKEVYAMSLFLHTDPFSFDSGLLYNMLTDPDFMEKKVGSLLTVYHYLAINSLRDQLNMGGKLLHPVCEFGLPEYYIAISAINSLCDRETGAENRFFMDYAYDQMILHNGLLEGRAIFRQSDPEVARAAAETLRALPFLHSQTKKLLGR
jgi:hypothetical protein